VTRGPALLISAYALLTAAWVFSNPPYAAPDEWAHFVRAASIGEGQLIGRPAEGPVLGAPPPGQEGGHEQRERWAAQNTRVVDVPSDRIPTWLACSADPNIPALCLAEPEEPPSRSAWAIPTGNYQPFAYLLPALVTRIDASPDSLDRAGRALKALLAVALIALAIHVTWVGGAWGLSAIGVVVAATPMVLFLAGSLNPSGLEITAGIAFLASLLRLVRDHGGTRFTWAAVAASGVVLALSRGTAPLWIGFDGVVVLALAGPRTVVGIVRRSRPASFVALAVVALAVLANRAWEVAYGPDFVVDPTPVDLALRAGWLELPQVLRQHVGVFDYLEFGLTPLAYLLWLGLTAALFTIAQVLGSRRERIVLCATLATTLLVPVLLVALIMRHTGYGLQGRYVMAFSVAVPLLAGEVVTRHRDALVSLRATALLVPVALAAAVVHVHAVVTNAKRFAVGVNGPEWFLGSAVWSPPGGWLLWLVAAVVGAAALVLASVLEARGSRRP
jgi:hypothetical protein